MQNIPTNHTASKCQQAVFCLSLWLWWGYWNLGWIHQRPLKLKRTILNRSDSESKLVFQRWFSQELWGYVQLCFFFSGCLNIHLCGNTNTVSYHLQLMIWTKWNCSFELSMPWRFWDLATTWQIESDALTTFNTPTVFLASCTRH